MKKTLLISFLTLSLSLATFLMYPSPIDSAAWNPPPAPALSDSPQTAANTRLTTELLAEGEIYGPEDVAVDSQGRVYAGTQDGLIKRVLTDGTVETWVDLGGRPLGLHFDRIGKLKLDN
ncbi:MAG: hypothetical protein L3J22_06290 [Xanthomonadales bacterium]|nr:hypothetical protein [Xanthomonadales bacterium]